MGNVLVDYSSNTDEYANVVLKKNLTQSITFNVEYEVKFQAKLGSTIQDKFQGKIKIGGTLQR